MAAVNLKGNSVSRTIRVLLVEDSDNDALLLLRHLHKGGYAPVSKAVDNAQDMVAALEQQPWDIVISDYVMKHNLTRLVPAVERELRDAEIRRERTRSLTALRESEERFRQLAENIE